MKDELARLLLVEKIRKRAADVAAESLRDIFNEECRNALIHQIH